LVADNIFDAWTGSIPSFDPVMTGPANPDLIPPQMPTLDYVLTENVESSDGTGAARTRLAIGFTMPPGLSGVSVEARYRVIATIDTVDYEGPWVYTPGVDSQIGTIYADAEQDLTYEAQVRSRRGERVSTWTGGVIETMPPVNERLVTTATSYNRSNFWRRSVDGTTWSPVETTVDGTVTFRASSGEIASRTIRATLTTSNGNIATTAQANTGEATSWSASGDGTGTVTVTVTHTQSGVQETLNFASLAALIPTTVSANGSGTTTASATITRGGAQTTIIASFRIGGNQMSAANPFPITLTLRRGGSGGTIIKEWTNIGGYYEPGGGGDPAVAIGSGGGTYIDTDTGTGSTEYYVSVGGSSFTRTIDVTATQTYFS
jgi:hypothetical protein